MAASGERRPRRGPAPIASFDHDVSDEVRPPSSPETKQSFQLPEIREDPAAGPSGSPGLAAPVQRARSLSTPGPGPSGAAAAPGLGGLGAPAAPRIDISRASSSSHHDSRDSSPELALFAGTAGEQAPAHLGFREDGASDLRSSTEELAFLEPAPATPAAPAPRRHSRKDSQGSEAALLAISGRTSRLSSIGSQCSAQSALSATSRVSRLSVVSGASRSPSPHKMLLETSFCGPKPIETDPEVCAAAVEERLFEIAKQQSPQITVEVANPTSPAAVPDARDHREVRTEATVETAPAPRPPAVTVSVTACVVTCVTPAPPDDDKHEKETKNRARAEERRARSRERRDRPQPEVYKNRNRSKDVIRIKLKPSEEYDDDDDDDDDEEDCPGGVAGGGCARKPQSLALGGAARPRSPSPAPAPPSRKSSFCSLFKSRETIASPDSPLGRKKSLTEGRSRSKSRDRSAPSKLRGSVLSLFKPPRRSNASPSPSSRAASPGPPPAGPPAPSIPPPAPLRGLKYYEPSRDGIIHIPLRSPPDEPGASAADTELRQAVRPASAPCARGSPGHSQPDHPKPSVPIQRTVLPDGSIIIPLHSPTERSPPVDTDLRHEVAAVVEPTPKSPTPPPQTVKSPPPSQPAMRSPSPPPLALKSTSPSPPAPQPPLELESDPPRRRKERLVFTTHVGSTEQVFSTQLSITKTPSVTSEMSSSFPSLRDSHIAETPGTPSSGSDGGGAAGSAAGSAVGSVAGSEAEQRGLVVQESFEEELPYVPTTLPLERPRALPMLPVRDRGPHTHTTASVERPRSAVRPPAGLRAPPPPPPPPPGQRLRIRLPRRSTTTAVTTTTTTTTTSHVRPRTRSGGEVPDSTSTPPPPAADTRSEWIDFSEVPERRKAARRIQTLPAEGTDDDGAGYVEPDQCRCECHRAGTDAHDAASPQSYTSPESSSSAHVRTSVVTVARPFTADLDLTDSPDAARS